MPQRTSSDKQVRLRLPRERLNPDQLERAKALMEKHGSRNLSKEGKIESVLPLDEVAEVRKKLKEFGVRPQLIPEFEPEDEEGDDSSDEVIRRKLGRDRILPTERLDHQRRAGRLHRIAPVRLNLPVGLLDHHLTSQMRWWKPDPVDLPEIEPGEVNLIERQITLLDGREVEFIQRREHDPEADIPTKHFFLREGSGRVVDVNEMALDLLPLYGADRLSDDEETVVVCEGIAATDALLDRGYSAVGTLTGALNSPAREALRILAGRKVLLWPDNDDLGVAHMAGIEVELQRMNSSTRLVRWKDGPHKGDAADFIEHDRDIEALLNEAERWDPKLLNAASYPPRLNPQNSPLRLSSTRRLGAEQTELKSWPTTN